MLIIKIKTPVFLEDGQHAINKNDEKIFEYSYIRGNQDQLREYTEKEEKSGNLKFKKYRSGEMKGQLYENEKKPQIEWIESDLIPKIKKEFDKAVKKIDLSIQ
jgi:hypothetical protein